MFNTGDTVILEDLYTGEVQRYRSKLIECNDMYCMIDYPIDEHSKKRVMLENGRDLQIYITTKKKDVYYFNTTLVGRKYEQVPVILLSFPGKSHVKQVQRRRYVRVDNVIDADVYSVEHEFAPFKTLTNDISAGGVSLCIPVTYEFKFNRRLLVQIVLKMRDESVYPLNVIGNERRMVQKNNEVTTLSLEFDTLNNKDSRMLVRYCFEQQLIQRKKT